ncbi:MAG TPA: AAA family ATPase, partial [Nitrospiria bacterium]|nr:AAA family ATPase [Nitrospiria bacterium]
MYLKKLELIGFKSFAEATVVRFQPGITAIVGPNGCGKSNIVDAVLWVLGEQSTKALRSDRMEDVIFNGSETRRPLNLSQVILTVGDVTGEIAGQFGDYQEIAISRRLFRTGESEYLINKAPCRLKDIRDLLIDTGAGHKGHTIIEQGKVDQLLNASPLERRELIEETAGISKYKLRKAEAERKLDSTQQNLLRVRDIIGEVKRQINTLDRQVKKTELFQGLQTEARKLELSLLISEYRDHRTTLSEVLRQIADLKTDESRLLAELSKTEAELQSVKTGALQKETALSSLKQGVHDTQTLIHRQENRIELLRNQIHSWEEQRTKLAQEQSRLEQTLTQSVTQGEETER